MPSLHAVSRPLAEVPADLLSFADPASPLAWMRGDRGCVGVGEVLRLRFRGPDRFAKASRAWREVSAAATVTNPVGLPGSGLVALGTFAFGDGAGDGDRDGDESREGSAEPVESVLIVPRLLVARHRGTAWITEVSTQPISGEPQLPETTPAGTWSGARLPVADADRAYLDGVVEATARVEQRSVEKIVLARRVEGAIDSGDDLRVPLRRLADQYQDCWTYAVDGMIGASPETLVRQTDGAISARVLAGTRGRHRADPIADARARDELLTSAKEQHEHAFAVQSVVTALAPHVSGLRTSDEPFALQLPNVWHLATDLGAIPGDGGSSLELTAALHPTAAVAGTPAAEAVEAIAELEPFDRGRYAGPVGWIDAEGEGEWVIALRCASVGVAHEGSRTVTAYAGGGIVAGSNPGHEFAETVSKFAPIADAFSASGGGVEETAAR